MATVSQPKKSANGTSASTTRKTTTGDAQKKAAASGSSRSPRQNANGKHKQRSAKLPEVPNWLTAVASVVGVGVAVGAGLYATRHQWMSKAEEWRDTFSAAFADDETDYENFDQTRHSGPNSTRDHDGEDWEDVDHMSDASFPASDPPSFNPGTA